MLSLNSLSQNCKLVERVVQNFERACNTVSRTFNSSVSDFVRAGHFCTGKTSVQSKWFAFSATSGQAIIRFALNVSLSKVRHKLCLIVIFAFSVQCSLKKFRFQKFFLFSIRSRSRNCFVSVSTKRSRNFRVSVSKTLKRFRSRTKQSRLHPCWSMTKLKQWRRAYCVFAYHAPG